MRPLRETLLCLLALAPLAGAEAQGLVWEQISAFHGQTGVALAPDGEIWGAGTDLHRLDLSNGLPGTWVEVRDLILAHRVHFLSADTLVALIYDQIERSTDRGQTWSIVWEEDGGSEFLFEVPAGHPHAGTLFAHQRPENPVRSTDRGATWAPATFDTSVEDNEMYAMLAVPSGPWPPAWPPGRLVAGGSWGLTVSDDGGASFQPVHPWQYARYLCFGLAAVEGPGGLPRLLALVVENTQPNLRIWASDDGGSTWAQVGAVPASHVKAMAGLGGASALVVTSEGNVWRTDDAGLTWDVVGQTPTTDGGQTSRRVKYATVLGDGRLYVHLHGGDRPQELWRTTEPVIVASDDVPVADDGLALAVSPNPSGGDTAVALTLAEAAHVRVAVYDVLGREVAVVADRALGSGEHAVPLSGDLAPGTYVVRAEVSSAGAAHALVRTFTVAR